MPPGRTATAAPRKQARTPPRPRPRRLSRTAPLRRVRWDRVGRVGLLVVLAVVAGLYVQQALAYLSVRSQSQQQQAIVRDLERQNASLAAQQRTLRNPATVQREARALGMVRLGEHPYVITGLPNH
jgi:cell division protein FtsB